MFDRVQRDRLVEKYEFFIFGGRSINEITEMSFEQIFSSVTPTPYINEIEEGLFKMSNEELLDSYSLVIHHSNIETINFLQTLNNIFLENHYIDDVKTTVVAIHKNLRLLTLNDLVRIKIMLLLDMEKEIIDDFVVSHNSFIDTLFRNYFYKIANEGIIPNYSHYYLKITGTEQMTNKGRFLLEKNLKNTLAIKLQSCGREIRKELRVKYGYIDILLSDKFAIELKKDSITLNHCLQVKKYLFENNYKPVLIGWSITEDVVEAAIDFGITVYTYYATKESDDGITLMLSHICGLKIKEIDELISSGN